MRCIEYETKATYGDDEKELYIVTIFNQTHTGNGFGNRGYMYYSEKLDCTLLSAGFPKIAEYTPRNFFVQGSYEPKDSEPMYMNRAQFELWRAVVEEYNKTYYK